MDIAADTQIRIMRESYEKEARNLAEKVVLTQRELRTQRSANGELTDKIEGLESDLKEAVRVAYNRGATEWTRLNYRAWFEEFGGSNE